jgi:hypothetical protein
MTKKIYEKVMLVGRATTFTVGLAVVLALSVGWHRPPLQGRASERASSWGRPTP